LKTWIKGFLDNAAPSDPENFPFIVMGNKSDKEDERQVTTAQA
jgi:Ras-related protein Rab-7A